MSESESIRRRYWSDTMEDAAEFMLGLDARDIEESNEPLVSVTETSQDWSELFVVAKANDAGTTAREVRIRSGLVEPLLGVAEDFRKENLLLRIEHAYRPPEMQAELVSSPILIDRVIDMVRWEHDGLSVSAQTVYRRLMVLAANVFIMGTHLSGSAVDVSVIDQKTGSELDRGGPYLTFSEVSAMESPFVSDIARHNRARITRVFEAHGFSAYPYEFWHYCQGDVISRRVSGSSAPARYGPISVKDGGEVVALADPSSHVIPVQDLLAAISERLTNRDPSRA